MQSGEIRTKFLEFFKKRGHAIIPSASLVTTDEKGITNPTLFNTAGMQPLIPYLLGKSHPEGKRLADVQKCVRTVDIDDIGDKTHATFFEMLGNWSLGDYFKEDAIKWSFEFLTSKKEGLGLDPNRLYITVFEGNEDAPRDTEAAEIWKNIFEKEKIKGERIFFMGAELNWWQAGDNGPCGPDTEMYYDVTGKIADGMTKEKFIEADKKRDVVEVWNDVFMQYEKKDGKVAGKLKANNVDTGAGLERLCMVTQNVDNIYDTDLLKPVMDELNKISPDGDGSDLRAKRIIADHIRTSVFLIADGVVPSNTDRGYVLRRLIRRAVRFGKQIGLPEKIYSDLVETIAQIYEKSHSNIRTNVRMIVGEINKEVGKFAKTLDRGIKEFEKISKDKKEISGTEAFDLFQSYGFPLELTLELAGEKEIKADKKGFEEEFKKHQKISRVGAEKKFKGGLAATGEMETKYHTATHLLNAALRKVLGEHVFQKGSNITAERMRFDFSHPQKMTDEEKKKVEDLVNEKISEKLPVVCEELPKEEAKKSGAIRVFDDKYGDIVKVYKIGDKKSGIFSMELCGGPHVGNTSELGHFKIQKEEAVSAGVRRIKATLE